MKNFSCNLILIIFSFYVTAQDKKNIDIKAIKSMCGCFEVSFKFSETFVYSSNSTYQPSKKYNANALEWAELVSDENDNIIIQHILIAGNEDNPYVIKHWRQDWIYENTHFYLYNQNNQWNYIEKDKNQVKGQWTQKVFQVDDSPRYEGSASWVHVDGRSYWYGTADAPLPRREATKRDDYNVTLRRNHHEIFDWGWSHDQDNDKLVRKPGTKDFILAQEKGVNNYKRVDNSRCDAAKSFWNKNKTIWNKVRNHWNSIFERKIDLKLKTKVEDKRLFQFLFALEKNSKSDKITSIIDDFIL